MFKKYNFISLMRGTKCINILILLLFLPTVLLRSCHTAKGQEPGIITGLARCKSLASVVVAHWLTDPHRRTIKVAWHCTVINVYLLPFLFPISLPYLIIIFLFLLAVV